MARWDTFESRLVIQADLRAVTALRIGAASDDAAQPAASDLPILVDANGAPYIPGSSLRGALRSHLERFVRSVERMAGQGKGACFPTEENALCVTAKDLNGTDGSSGWRQQVRGRSDGELWLANQIWDNSCRVCQAFGSPWLASRVRISDLALTIDEPVPVLRRDGVAIHREKETVQHKYDFETLPPNTAFALYIVAENLTMAERGLLWLGLRELQDGNILLGGFKGRGLGRVTLDKLTIKGVEASDRASLRHYILRQAMAEVSHEQMDGWLETLIESLELGA